MEVVSGLSLLILSSWVTADPVQRGEIPAVKPEYLDMLLTTGQYDEFSWLMGIDDPSLTHPGNETTNSDPMFNKGLFMGDMILPRETQEEARQGINHRNHPNSKWPKNEIPYTIASEFTATNIGRIRNAIDIWNRDVPCIKWKPHSGETSYVTFFPGNGCYSNLGRTGRQQSLSLQQNGCFRVGTILHEMNHATGFTHEQNRSDRDEYLKILWENIPQDWRSQYRKVDASDFGNQADYDYYSAMHYGVAAPETGKPAFEVLKPNVDKNRIGQRNGLTATDIKKISVLYC